MVPVEIYIGRGLNLYMDPKTRQQQPPKWHIFIPDMKLDIDEEGNAIQRAIRPRCEEALKIVDQRRVVNLTQLTQEGQAMEQAEQQAVTKVDIQLDVIRKLLEKGSAQEFKQVIAPLVRQKSLP